MARLPKRIRDEVSRVILQQAVEVGWEDLTNAKRSAFYEEWANSSEIGGRLADYIPSERIRVWIKDGPIKELRRARQGLGPYASLVPKSLRLERQITDQVLGPDWTPVEGSAEIKPNKFDAERGEHRVTIVWGNRADFKHLVWAWLNHSHPEFCSIVVLDTRTAPITPTAKTNYDLLAKRLGTTITYLNMRG